MAGNGGTQGPDDMWRDKGPCCPHPESPMSIPTSLYSFSSGHTATIKCELQSDEQFLFWSTNILKSRKPAGPLLASSPSVQVRNAVLPASILSSLTAPVASLPSLTAPYTDLQNGLVTQWCPISLSILMPKGRLSPCHHRRSSQIFFTRTKHWEKNLAFHKASYFYSCHIINPPFQKIAFWEALEWLSPPWSPFMTWKDSKGELKAVRWHTRSLPSPTTAHRSPWLSSTRLNRSSHVSQLYFNTITKGQRRKANHPSMLLSPQSKLSFLVSVECLPPESHKGLFHHPLMDPPA